MLSQNSNTTMQEHDRHIRAIERHGRREWYKLSGCTERSMVENAVYRYKATIGSEMRARTLARQRVEHRIGCEILNPNRKIFEARKRETAALGAGEKLVLGHPLAATIGDSARCMQNLEKVLFTGPKTSDTVTFICD